MMPSARSRSPCPGGCPSFTRLPLRRCNRSPHCRRPRSPRRRRWRADRNSGRKNAYAPEQHAGGQAPGGSFQRLFGRDAGRQGALAGRFPDEICKRVARRDRHDPEENPVFPAGEKNHPRPGRQEPPDVHDAQHGESRPARLSSGVPSAGRKWNAAVATQTRSADREAGNGSAAPEAQARTAATGPTGGKTCGSIPLRSKARRDQQGERTLPEQDCRGKKRNEDGGGGYPLPEHLPPDGGPPALRRPNRGRRSTVKRLKKLRLAETGERHTNHNI